SEDEDEADEKPATDVKESAKASDCTEPMGGMMGCRVVLLIEAGSPRLSLSDGHTSMESAPPGCSSLLVPCEDAGLLRGGWLLGTVNEAVQGRKASLNVFNASSHFIVLEIGKELITITVGKEIKKSPPRKGSASSREADKSAPDETGKHQLSIIWYGQHLPGSPSTLNMDDSTNAEDDLTLQRPDSADSQSSEKNYPLQRALLRRRS
ncbi:hypothetical protein MTO96_030187, partial [Rhipicephalus appendiculatus]